MKKITGKFRNTLTIAVDGGLSASWITKKTARRTAFSFALTALAAMIFSVVLLKNNQHAQDRAAIDLPVLQGEGAIDYLKKDGSFESLSEAVAAARYSVDRNEKGASADNDANDLHMNFTADGLRLNSTFNEKNWNSNWSLKSFGYGDNQKIAAKGDLQTNGNRVELKRDTQNLTEWFINEKSGVEHGFTLAEKPFDNSNDQALRLVMNIGGDLTARANEDGQMLSLLNENGEKVLRYEKLKVWDSLGKELIARMRTDENTSEVWYEVEDRTAVYPLTIDPMFVGETRIQSTGGSANELFGSAVGVSGSTVIVGAFNADGKGAAYIFVNNGTGWTQQQKLTASDGASNDNFGTSVAISGDTAIVGATLDEVATGSAYVFVRNGTTWSQQQKLTASDGGQGSFYGSSVAIEENTAVVGAYNGPSSDGEPSGAAYVYVRNGASWSQQQKLTASDANEGRFGNSVDISGNTVVVSSELSDVGGNESQGAAYIYVRNGTVWTQQQKITAADGVDSGRFGNSVAISGDTVIAGNSTRNSAYIFLRTGTNWSQQQKLLPAGGSSFGDKVAISGNNAFVSNSSPQESVFYFIRTGTIWTQEQIITASDGAPNDGFGSSIAVSETTLIVGAMFDNSNRGSAYIYGMPTITVNITSDQPDPTPTDGICDVDPATSGFQCSLRAAIETANGNAGTDSINFNIPGGGIQTIAPNGSLPEITGTTLIDGSTQPGYTNSPVIEIRGDLAGPGADGLIFDAGSDNSKVSGLAVNRFYYNVGFLSSNNKIESCYIGLNANGSAAGTQRSGFGIAIGNEAADNQIGGINGSTGNVISNTDVGILIINASENKVLGNRIGTNPAGTEAIPNQTGVQLQLASMNTIGDPDGNGNLISGNNFNIRAADDSANNRIVGNTIGTKLNGVETLPNDFGIVFESGATGNIIEDNVIGGNDGASDAGIIFLATAGAGNLLIKNHIGVARNGTSSIRNTVGILNFSDGQIIGSQEGPNVIGYNEKAGIWITFSGTGSNPLVENNVIQYNLIGTNGTTAIGNEELGIWINQNAKNNQITNNVVSGNGVFGIVIADGANSNTISQNKVGVDQSGNSAIPNGGGIWIRQAQDNTINSNLVSGNDIGMLIGTDIGIGQNFVSKYNSGSAFNAEGVKFTSGNKIFGNIVGLNQNGNASLPSSIGIAVGENARNNMIGTSGGSRNIISGNTATLGYGIFLGTFTANPDENILPQNNTFVKNVIGLGSNLQTPVPNRVGFVVLGAKQNVIGGDSGDLANIIVANTEEGINLVSASEANNFLNNYIGVLPPGFGNLLKNGEQVSLFGTNYGNGGNGISISGGSSQNTFGGNNTNTSLVIANNGGNGILLTPTAGNGNRIGSNSIFGNNGISVDIGGDGFTPNDLHDGDIGPNNLQNYPEIVSKQIIDGELIVKFKVDSAPENSDYGKGGIRVEIFKADASGQGQLFLGAVNYTVADYNNGSPLEKTANLGNINTLGITAADPITSTATDASGNSSEFTPAFNQTTTNVSVSGKVSNSIAGIPDAIVTLTNSSGVTIKAKTNSFGYYSFKNVEPGRTYTMSVTSRRYTFAPREITVTADVQNVDFTVQENVSPMRKK